MTYVYMEWDTIKVYNISNLYNTRRKIVEVILLNFRSNLGHKDKLEVI